MGSVNNIGEEIALKKQYRAVDPDPGAGTVTIEDSGKNFTGSKTVKLK